MSKISKESFFWTSYSDLMTSMFFVMLVLFVLVIALLYIKMSNIEAEGQATREQLNKIREIEDSVKNIDPNYFQYDFTFRRHTLVNIEISFRTGSSDINDINEEQRNRLVEAGKAIEKFVTQAVKDNNDVKYLLIIEGQSSKDNYMMNYELSYKRALSLVRHWSENGLQFNPDTCEVIVSGSGQSSPFRESPDIVGNRRNQRFVVHIIPKISNLSAGDL